MFSQVDRSHCDLQFWKWRLVILSLRTRELRKIISCQFACDFLFICTEMVRLFQLAVMDEIGTTCFGLSAEMIEIFFRQNIFRQKYSFLAVDFFHSQRTRYSLLKGLNSGIPEKIKSVWDFSIFFLMLCFANMQLWINLQLAPEKTVLADVGRKAD